MENVVKCKYCDMILKNTPKGIGGHNGRYHKDDVQANKKIVEFTLHCKECNKLVANSNNVLGRHVRKEHGLEYPDYLVKHEHNGIWPTCACGCAEKVKWHMGGFSRFFSKACGSGGVNNGMYGKKGTESPNFGKVRTEKMRETYSKSSYARWEKNGAKFREKMQSDEYRQKQSESNKQSYASTDRAQRVANSLNEFWSSGSEITQQRRKEASNRAIELQTLGKIGPQAPYKTQWFLNPFTGKQEYMHSSWETLFLEHCISVGVSVTKAHSIRIEYVGPDGKNHHYVPDFITTDDYPDRILFEVKGIEDEWDTLKETAGREWCVNNEFQYVKIRKQSKGV